MVGAVEKFCILVFLEAFKAKFNDFSKSIFALPKSGGHGPSAHLSLYSDPAYLFTVFLFYLYYCANIIAKWITKAKALAIIQN